MQILSKNFLSRKVVYLKWEFWVWIPAPGTKSKNYVCLPIMLKLWFVKAKDKLKEAGIGPVMKHTNEKSKNGEA